MTRRSQVKSLLLIAMVMLSLGGLLLHSRIHPISKNASNSIPVILAFLSVIVVPLLFSFRKTISYAYVLNGFSALIGTIVMFHFSLARWPDPVTIQSIILNTTLADIVILWGKFFIGKALFDLESFGYDQNRSQGGKPWRYPNMGWWLVHLGGLSLVYALGHLYWR
jgi:hypothetical protein